MASNDLGRHEPDTVCRQRTPEVCLAVASRPRPESFESRLDETARAAYLAGFRAGAFAVPSGVSCIPVGSGLCALVDSVHRDAVLGSTWRAYTFPNGRVEYVVRATGDKRQLHRWLLPEPPAGFEIDHRNHLVLDNRLSNLRAATRMQNAWNSWRTKRETNTSLLFGVSATKGGWLSAIKHYGKMICIGVYSDEVEAGVAYDELCLELRGEFAVLNFPSRVQR
jgi:hypothetical protein